MKKRIKYRSIAIAIIVLITVVVLGNVPIGNTTFVKAAAQFLTVVAHDTTLAGDGTSTVPLTIANNGVGTNNIVNGAITAAKIGSGQAVKSVNGLRDDILLTAGSNISITPSGNTLTISSLLGLTSVSHDATLFGDGTSGNPLGLANSSVGNNQLANNAITVSKISPGQVVTGINNLTDGITLAAGSNISITPSGNTLTIAASSVPSSSQPYINPLRVATLQWYEANQTGISFPVGDAPSDVAFDGENIWVTNFLSSNVTRLRASGGANPGTFAVGAGPRGIAFDGANMWVCSFGSGDITKLRASDGANLGTLINVTTNPIGIAFDGANLWVIYFQDDFVAKFRASDGVFIGTFVTGSRPRGIAFDGANIWTANAASGTVTKLRASDGANLGTFPVGQGVTGIAFDGANMWVTSDSAVTKLRASDGANLGTFPVGQASGGLAFDGANMWVVTSLGVTKFRVSDNANLGTFAAGQDPTRIAFDGANMWITNFQTDSITKL